MKRELRLRARQLRQSGLSLKEIARELDVSLSSISLWVRDIVLTDEQVNQLEQRRKHYAAQNKGAQTNRKNGLILRKQYQLEGQTKARDRRPLHMMGCMLYWAEGSKSRNTLQFANSDSNMIAMFAHFLRQEMNVKDSEICVYIHCHTADLDEQQKIESYWLDLLRLPQEQLRKTYFKRGSNTVHKTLEHGVCRLAVNKSSVLQHIFGAIQEYGGFDEPAWLG
jgi:transposase-like protein